jgi:hypothetical protein
VIDVAWGTDFSKERGIYCHQPSKKCEVNELDQTLRGVNKPPLNFLPGKKIAALEEILTLRNAM